MIIFTMGIGLYFNECETFVKHTNTSIEAMQRDFEGGNYDFSSLTIWY